MHGLIKEGKWTLLQTERGEEVTATSHLFYISQTMNKRRDLINMKKREREGQLPSTDSLLA